MTPLADRLRAWYEGGLRGCEAVCATEGAPPAVQDAVRHWFRQGWRRLDAILADLELIEGPPTEERRATIQYIDEVAQMHNPGEARTALKALTLALHQGEHRRID